MTLENDVAESLRDMARKSGKSFKEVVNETLRRGLATGSSPARRGPRFRVHPKACGFRAGIDLVKLNQWVDEPEIERAGCSSFRIVDKVIIPDISLLL